MSSESTEIKSSDPVESEYEKLGKSVKAVSRKLSNLQDLLYSLESDMEKIKGKYTHD